MKNASVTKIRSRRAISCLRDNFRRNGEDFVVIRSREVGVVDHDEAFVVVAAIGKEGLLLRDAFGDAGVDGRLDDVGAIHFERAGVAGVEAAQK